jgi:hypothetical protein
MMDAREELCKHIGRRVRLTAEHTVHAGEYGVFVAVEDTIFGPRPVVQLDESEQRVFVMKPSEWIPLPVERAATSRGVKV